MKLRKSLLLLVLSLLLVSCKTSDNHKKDVDELMNLEYTDYINEYEVHETTPLYVGKRNVYFNVLEDEGLSTEKRALLKVEKDGSSELLELSNLESDYVYDVIEYNESLYYLTSRNFVENDEYYVTYIVYKLGDSTPLYEIKKSTREHPPVFKNVGTNLYLFTVEMIEYDKTLQTQIVDLVSSEIIHKFEPHEIVKFQQSMDIYFIHDRLDEHDDLFINSNEILYRLKDGKVEDFGNNNTHNIVQFKDKYIFSTFTIDEENEDDYYLHILNQEGKEIKSNLEEKDFQFLMKDNNRILVNDYSINTNSENAFHYLEINGDEIVKTIANVDYTNDHYYIGDGYFSMIYSDKNNQVLRVFRLSID